MWSSLERQVEEKRWLVEGLQCCFHGEKTSHSDSDSLELNDSVN